jgi:hypothetical protein
MLPLRTRYFQPRRAGMKGASDRWLEPPFFSPASWAPARPCLAEPRGLAGKRQLPAGWKMWKPQGAPYNDKGQRVCDNQSCDKCLTKERYALVVDKQKWSDTRAIDPGESDRARRPKLRPAQAGRTRAAAETRPLIAPCGNRGAQNRR